MPVKLQEEVLVQRHSAFRLGINLDHPTLYALGVELVVDGGIERVGEVDAPAVAADFDHLRPAVERLVGLLRVPGAPNDSAKMQRAGFLGVERIAHVVLNELTTAPAGHVEEAVV